MLAWAFCLSTSSPPPSPPPRASKSRLGLGSSWRCTRDCSAVRHSAVRTTCLGSGANSSTIGDARGGANGSAVCDASGGANGGRGRACESDVCDVSIYRGGRYCYWPARQSDQVKPGSALVHVCKAQSAIIYTVRYIDYALAIAIHCKGHRLYTVRYIDWALLDT